MTTLALRFAGSHQSWGSSAFNARNTEQVPTRAAVLGMLAAALGWERGRTEPWLHELDIQVRVDRAGRQVEDFHTVNPPTEDVAAARFRSRLLSTGKKADTRFTVPNADGKAWMVGSRPQPLVTRRRYLADAEFIVVIAHPDASRVNELLSAVRGPVFMPYLGRKACAPAFPFVLGTFRVTADQVLAEIPTRSPRPLAVHQIVRDRNPVSHRVAPPVVDTLDEILAGVLALR